MSLVEVVATVVVTLTFVCILLLSLKSRRNRTIMQPPLVVRIIAATRRAEKFRRSIRSNGPKNILATSNTETSPGHPSGDIPRDNGSQPEIIAKKKAKDTHTGKSVERTIEVRRQKSPKADDHLRVQVYFATNRQVAVERDGYHGFTPKPSEGVQYGTYDVEFPSQGYLADVWKLGGLSIAVAAIQEAFANKGSNNANSLESQLLKTADWKNAISNSLPIEERAEPVGLIFIHGFNSTFEKSALDTAMLARACGPHVVPVCISWPTVKSLLPIFYVRDSDTSATTAFFLAGVLDDILTSLPWSKVVVVCHSRGAMMTSLAMPHVLKRQASNSQGEAPKIDLIFVAPDVSADDFRILIKQDAFCGASVSVYTAKNDKALFASRWGVNHRERLGRISFEDACSGKTGLDFDRFTLVDANEVSTKSLFSLGHGYYDSNVDVGYDIQQTVRGVGDDRTWRAKAEPVSGGSVYRLRKQRKIEARRAGQ